MLTFREVCRKCHGRCVYCGKNVLADFDSWMNAQVDHFVPRKAGGEDTLENTVLACSVCNGFKRDYEPKSLDDARRYIAAKRAARMDEYLEDLAIESVAS